MKITSKRKKKLTYKNETQVEYAKMEHTKNFINYVKIHDTILNHFKAIISPDLEAGDETFESGHTFGYQPTIWDIMDVIFEQAFEEFALGEIFDLKMINIENVVDELF